MHTNLFQLSPKLHDLITQVFIGGTTTHSVREFRLSGLSRLLLRLLTWYVDISALAKVRSSVRMWRTGSGPWDWSPSLVRVLLLEVRRWLLSVLLRLWSVRVVGIENGRRWCVGPLWWRPWRWPVLIGTGRTVSKRRSGRGNRCRRGCRSKLLDPIRPRCLS